MVGVGWEQWYIEGKYVTIAGGGDGIQWCLQDTYTEVLALLTSSWPHQLWANFLSTAMVPSGSPDTSWMCLLLIESLSARTSSVKPRVENFVIVASMMVSASAFEWPNATKQLSSSSSIFGGGEDSLWREGETETNRWHLVTECCGVNGGGVGDAVDPSAGRFK